MFLINDFNETQFEDDVIDTEVIDTDDVEVTETSQKISFSNGVVFTPEELDAMDPEVKAKLQKVKADEAQMQKGFNAKLQALKATKQVVKPATTPAPTAEPTSNMDPLVKQTVYGMVVEKNLARAKEHAIRKYGEQVVNLMLAKAEVINAIDTATDEADVNFDFTSFFTNTFAVSLSEDAAILNAFNVFKGLKSNEDVQKEAEEKARLTLLQGKKIETSGLPDGGARTMTPPVEAPAPTSMAAAKERAAQIFAALKNKEN